MKNKKILCHCPWEAPSLIKIHMQKNSLPDKVRHTIIEGQDSRGAARSGVFNAVYRYTWKFRRSLTYPPG